MSTLARLLEVLGPDVVTPLLAPAGTDVEVDSVVIHDPADPPPLTRGALVLGVGMTPGADLRALMERAAAEGAVLVLKVADQAAPAVLDAAQTAAVTVVSVAPGATWMQMASLLRAALIDDATARGDERLGGVAAGDLFAVANAVAALIDAPVTIEDRQSRVIAFSARQDEADEARMSTILGQQVPETYHRTLVERGVFRQLHRSDHPIVVDGVGPDVLPRVAMAVRAGDEVLGSIWAAVRHRPSDAQLREFGEAASFVALHLLRHRITTDVRREVQSDLVSVLLGGGPLATDVSRRLGLRGEGYRVLTAALRDSADDPLALAHCWDLLALHLSVLHRGAVTALLDRAVYAVLPVAPPAERSRQTAAAAARGFASRLPEPLGARVVVAVGGHAATLGQLPRSREDADRVARLLQRRTPAGSAAVATLEDVRTGVLLLRLADVESDSLPEEDALAAIVDHDARHGTLYLQTLEAWLDAMGDVNAAAGRLGVHHNTFRYRLQKVRQLPGIDLDDPEQRLALQIQLRMRALRLPT